jgi:WD40 repeat protein
LGLAISPDGQTAVSGSADRSMILWDLTTGKGIRRFLEHARAVKVVAFSQDGQQVVSGAVDGSLILWDAATGNLIRRFTGPLTPINGVAFSPDGRFVLSAWQSGSLRLWDITSGFEIRAYATDSGITSIALSADGRTVLSGLTDGSMRLLRILPSIRDLLDWTVANRFVGDLDCSIREQFRVNPSCVNGVFPTRTPYPLPTPTATIPVTQGLAIGGQATVKTSGGDNLNVRLNPGLQSGIVGLVGNGAQVTLLDGPRAADGLIWWRIRSADELEGWVVESADGEQTLVP